MRERLFCFPLCAWGREIVNLVASIGGVTWAQEAYILPPTAVARHQIAGNQDILLNTVVSLVSLVFSSLSLIGT
jgi:hypothetical protein